MLSGLKISRLAPEDPRRRLGDILGWLPVNVLQVISFVAVCLFLIPIALFLRWLSGSSSIPLWMAHKIWGPVVVGGGMARLKVRGREHWQPGKTYLIVGNHQSYFDIPILYSALPSPLHFLGVDYLRKVPGVGVFGEAVGTIFMSKSSPSQTAGSIRELQRYLQQGKSTVIFPEGVRSWHGEIGRFHSSLFAAAIRAGVEILPLAILDSCKVMPRGAGFLFRPATVEVRMGTPISTHNLNPKDCDRLAKKVRSSVESLHQGAQFPEFVAPPAWEAGSRSF